MNNLKIPVGISDFTKIRENRLTLSPSQVMAAG